MAVDIEIEQAKITTSLENGSWLNLKIPFS